MIGPGREATTELVGRTLCDIAQVLESAQDADGRVRAALELLGKIVLCRQCALLKAEPGFAPRLLAFPAMAAREENDLTAVLVKLFGKMLEERERARVPFSTPAESRLAVPLVGLGELIGILFVSRPEGIYRIEDLRLISVVAAQLAAYLMMLRSRIDEAGQNREVDEALRAARQARSVKDELARLVAFEMKAPFDASTAWLRMLGSGNLSAPAQARAVDALERGCRLRGRLVSDMLDLSSSGHRLELGPVEPTGRIETVVGDLQPLAEQRSIRLETAIDRSVKPVIADAPRLDEVFFILLANALESTPDGGQVRVHLEPAGDGARIQVIDSRSAVDAESPGQSLEIGLAIARQIVELHGGSFQAEGPSAEQGTTITVGLRAAP